MALTVKAVRGAAWTIATTVGSRGIGTIATLVITRFLAPSEYGEVMFAHVLTLTALYVANPGVDRYVIAFPKSGRPVAFHATALHLTTGVIGLGVVLLIGDALIPVEFDADRVMSFLPGLAAAALLYRLSQMPEKILTRDMRFRALALGRTAGNISFAGTSVVLAWADWGGQAIVIGNIVQYALQLVLFAASVDRRDWLEPCRLRWQTYRKLLEFGLPLSAGGLANMAARDWDDIIVGALFGPADLGAYRLAYRLADMPATDIGESIGDVLLPEFAHLDDDERRVALVRSTGVLTLLMAPMAVGLGLVAPTLVAVALPAEWQGVAPILTVLSVLSIVRPLGWTVGVYLQARDMTGWIMRLDVAKAIAVLGSIVAFSKMGILWVCGGIGMGFALHSLACLWVVDRYDGVSMKDQLLGLIGPIIACVPMAAAVLGARYGLLEIAPNIALIALLAVEITVGAATFVAAALILAPKTSGYFIELVKGAVAQSTGDRGPEEDGNQLGSASVKSAQDDDGGSQSSG